MTNPSQCREYMGEKEILQDGLISQKLISGSYNTFAGECVNEQLRNTFLNILDDEHRIQADMFGTMLVTGVMAHIAIQVILNVAVVTNTIPNTGITLPFISYGGTSVLFLLIEMGLVLSVSNQIRICR